MFFIVKGKWHASLATRHENRAGDFILSGGGPKHTSIINDSDAESAYLREHHDAGGGLRVS